MTDSVQEHENAPESAHILARIAEVLKENPENGLETVREAFEAECERAQKALREHAQDFDSLKEVRLGFFGDKGSLSLANRQMRDLENQHKGPVGKLLGQARAALTEAIETRTVELEAEREARILAEEAVDVTAATARHSLGGRHPVALMQEKLTDIFVGMGWEVADGPELESEWYNFDALNIKPDHPAREMQDTFYVEPKETHLLLRTHTSPVQMRSMLTRELPLYIVCPGQVYRTDELDATHTPVFHQIEGLAVDKGLTMADLKGTLEYMARAMFGEDAKIRLRPNFFPFTEPSAELDLWHPHAKGGPQWIEWGGCGMVHPNVLRAAGIDPNVYSGFAFGMGIERTLMFRNNVLDMHDMIEGDIRFSEQFGMEI
ncbi:phenylalanine--tRNA ligase subunit alpha [Rothia dentocariosa]|uniref:phenylalanine--tRNA ligase subunit alpha n=1 Tax=Rothia TaxID=32207 RepID=UPI00065FADDC|nr:MULTISPECIES: phenylalanine--tRNA ligase subunit alpha [Rothia]OFR95006.1 phenylalanine--tRNA ligase subunit alpha [Rothia sp. HMSC067H10]TFI36544.1 phenylalanine--tRNA ligase subunit alpha [Rothia dentocariosa]